MAPAESSVVAPPPPRRPLTRARIETLAGRALSSFGLVFGAMAVPALLSQQELLQQPGGWIDAGVVYLGLIGFAVAALVQRVVRGAAIFFAYAFLAATVAWPFLSTPSHDGPLTVPWLWSVLTVATGAAAFGMRLIDGIVYSAAAPICFGLALAESNGWRQLATAAFDTAYALLLGGILLVILAMMRHAASRVDYAQDAALGGYAETVHTEASEAERVEVDALVHDSVLTTLLAAAGARGPHAESVAADMAADALTHLSAGRSGADWDADGADVSRLAARLYEAVEAEEGLFELRVAGSLEAELSADAEDALYSAALQAMTNSIQHAGDGAHRLLAVTGTPAGVRIEVVDDGVGFDPDAIPPGRLGVEVSIRRRLAVAGGIAELSSRPGAGTSVVLRWPDSGIR